MKLFGIPIKVHWTAIFLLLLLMPTLTVAGLVHGLIIFVPVIIFLIGHELAHALMARKYGYHTRDISLHALGGLAHIEVLDQLTPKEDFWISLAGPLFNIFWVLVFAVLIWFAPLIGLAALIAPLKILFVVNVLLGVFNLIPGYPLDGGRISQALCVMKWGKKRGKEIAQSISFAAGSLMILTGLATGNLLFAGFGIFICFIAGKY